MIKTVIYRVAHAHPGGIPALAACMGISKHVLQNKINLHNATHHVTVEEAATIADLTNTDDIAREFAARRNLVCIPMVPYDGVSDGQLLDLFLSMEREKGEWMGSVQKALSDGMVDPHEFERIRSEGHEFCAAVAEVMSRLQSMVVERRREPRVRK